MLSSLQTPLTIPLGKHNFIFLHGFPEVQTSMQSGFHQIEKKLMLNSMEAGKPFRSSGYFICDFWTQTRERKQMHEYQQLFSQRRASILLHQYFCYQIE
jgi:hypothetical protein